MKTKKQNQKSKTAVIIATTILLFNLTAITQAAGLLKPINGGENSVKIKSHKVNVTINNGFAKTEVDQIFQNTGTVDLDAVYSFPIPKKASLSEVSYWINGKEVIGEVLEKEKAKKIHNEQKNKGKDTALAEKKDFKTFEISVSPVRAGKETRVRIVYYQPLEIDLGVGRYLYPLAEGGVDEEQIAFWSVDDEVTETFAFNLKLKSAFPVADVRLPHYDSLASITKNVVSNENKYVGDIYDVTFCNEENGSTKLSSDIVFYYRLAKDVPARVELIPYKQDKKSEGTFMAVVTPGASLKRIAEGTDWTFVLDVSGSMNGGKITTLVNGVAKVIGKMSPNDRFRIITFNNSAIDISGGYITATPENVKKYCKIVKNISAGGGTALFAGLSEAYKKLDADRTTGIILVTDGVCNIGSTRHAAFLKLIKQNDYRVFTFVIGNNANQPLLESLAKESGGFAMNISDNDDIVGRLIQAKAKVLHQKLYDAKLEIKGVKIKNITPKKIGNLYLGQQLIMFGQYKGSGEVELTFKAKIAGEKKEWKCKAYLPEIDTDNPELERLWALSSIDEIMQNIRENGETKDDRNQIVELGKEYSLVTDYTSMLVIEEEEMEAQGIQRKNAARVHRERKAQQHRTTQPVKNYSTSRRKSSGKGMFDGISAPHIGGSGPIGIISLIIIGIMKFKTKK